MKPLTTMEGVLDMLEKAIASHDWDRVAKVKDFFKDLLAAKERKAAKEAPEEEPEGELEDDLDEGQPEAKPRRVRRAA